MTPTDTEKLKEEVLSRIGSEFDGECHLTEEMARSLIAAIEAAQGERDAERSEKEARGQTIIGHALKLMELERESAEWAVAADLEKQRADKAEAALEAKDAEIERLRESGNNWGALAMRYHARVEETREALRPFAELDGEGNEDFPDEAKAMVVVGRVTDYTLTLGDIRKAAALLRSPSTEKDFEDRSLRDLGEPQS